MTPAFSVRGMLQDLFSDRADLVTLMRIGLDRLTDAEYLWEPVDGCWSVRPRTEQRTQPDTYLREGEWGLDIAYPDPKPPPFTTIAWRMTHLTGSMYIAAALLRGRRQPSGHLDASFPQHRAVPRTANEAVARWNDALSEVCSRLEDITDGDLWREESHEWGPATPGTGPPVWKQVLYFGYFEPASHAAEVRLIRDLYRHTEGGRKAMNG